MTQDTPLVSTPDQRTRLWVGYAVCLVAALIIWLLIGQYLASPATDPFIAQLDVSFYLKEGQQIRDGGLFAFQSAVHAYGYPLFVALGLALADLLHQPVLNIIIVIQLGLHLVSAGLAISLFERLTAKKPSISTRIAVFFLLVCNPILLTATYYLLSDSITVFWLTLMLAAGLSTWRGRWWIVGITLGICIVTRPYHQVWSIGLLILLLATLTFFRWVQRYSVYVNSRQALRGFLQIIIPVVLIVGLQYLIIHQNYGTWGMVGATGNKAIQIHITGSLYYYRYETLLQPDGFASGVRYINTDIQRHIAPLALQEPSMIALYVEQFRIDPLSLPLMGLVKIIGLFQHYDFRLFLLMVGITSIPAFLVGLGMFTMFVAIVQAGLLHMVSLIRQRPRSLKLTPPIVLFWVVVSYVGLYALATVPEPRFIFPIFPSITILGLYIMSQPQPRWQRWSAVIIAAVLYLGAMTIILPSAILG